MTGLAWLIVSAATALQLMNLWWVLSGIFAHKAKSQIPLVPCLLWYVALVIRGEGFFASSRGTEIAIVLIGHVLITLALAAVARRFGEAATRVL